MTLCLLVGKSAAEIITLDECDWPAWNVSFAGACQLQKTEYCTIEVRSLNFIARKKRCASKAWYCPSLLPRICERLIGEHGSKRRETTGVEYPHGNQHSC